MIASYLDIEADDVVPLKMALYGGRDLLYHASTMCLLEYADSLERLFIPYALQNTKIAYSYQYFIQHVRFSKNSKIASIPIVVIGAGAESDEDVAEYRNSNVTFSNSLGPACYAFSDFESLFSINDFIDRYGNDRVGDGSRHDVANRWGAFCLLYAVTAAGRSNPSKAEKLANQLSEDLYYKKLIRGLELSNVYQPLLEKLREVIRGWDQLAKKDFSVLLVEDELAVGWDDAYRAAIGDVKISTAVSFETAVEFVNAPIDLILLDVRLEGRRSEEGRISDHIDPKDLPGVKVARKFRAKLSTLPIIACTASDKATTLEVLQKQRVNAFWTKSHPDLVKTWLQIIEAAINFFDKLILTTNWSKKTRPLVDDFYYIAKTASINAPMSVQTELKNKADSFYALLFDEFSPDRKSISNNLQYDLGFLIVYSLINELIHWKCTEEWKGTSYKLYSNNDGKATLILAKSGSDYNFSPDLIKHLGFIPERSSSFPDIPVFQCVLLTMGLGGVRNKFLSLKDVRNKLSITHGKVDKSNHDGSQHADLKNIGDLLAIYKSMVNASA